MKIKNFEASLVVLSTSCLIFSLWNNIGVTFDSHLYLEGADHIEKFGFEDIFSRPTFRAKPILFPIILFLLGNNLLLVKTLNILCFIGIQILSFYLIDKQFEHKFVNKVAKFEVSFSTPIFLVHNFVWTEPLFILMEVLCFVIIFKFLEKDDVRHIIYLSLIGVLMVLHRHVGIIFVAITSAFIFYTKKRLSHFYFTLVPVVVFGMWQLLLWRETGSLDRIDHMEGLNLVGNINYFLQAFSKWFFPLVSGFEVFLSICIFLSILIIIFFAFEKIYSSEFLSYLSIFVACYFFFMIVKGELFYSDTERYLSLIYFPIVILFISGAEAIIKRLRGFKLTGNIILICWCTYTLFRSVKNILFWGEVNF